MKTSYQILTLVLLLVRVPAIAQNPTAAAVPCVPCEELLNLELPDLKIQETSSVDAPAAHCKILGVIGKEIHFELLLPQTWNVRFLMGGNGGFAGDFNDFLGNRKQVTNGYAVAHTDTGHKGSMWKGDWALNDMERQLNFGHLAVHRTAVVAKAILKQYYCTPPAFSYFYGCSKGGGQAMIAAQRYPEDFDGIVASAPALDWPAFAAAFIHNGRSIYPDPDQPARALITTKHVELLHHAVLEQCDAKDGVKDGILTEPTECRFDFNLLPKCPEKEAGDDCFTAEQIAGIRRIYDGFSVGGAQVHPGYPLGCENEPGAWIGWLLEPTGKTLQDLGYPTAIFALGVDVFRYLIFNDPKWDYRSYDFSRLKSDTRYLSSYLDATSIDYRAFEQRGGKMILFHGWNDYAQSAFTTIEHYEAAKKEDPRITEHFRLFLLPGVLHCGGGPGPSEADWVELVRRWVEEGAAPERVVLTKTQDGKVTSTRPVFPYPKKAVYDGKGDPNRESSFH